MTPTLVNIASDIILGAGGLLEAWTLLNRTAGDTLSERTRV